MGAVARVPPPPLRLRVLTFGSRIDYIFVPPETRVLEAAVLRDGQGETFPSDHFPVRATVEFPG